MINIARIGVCKLGLKGVLILEDGSIYYGCGFGAKGIVIGEVVFTTSMVGYPESLTDPSYHGQILIITHPLIGNYGVASKKLAFKGVPLHFESDRIWVRGLIISELTNSSHWSSIMSLHEWLLENNVPGLYRVDTRALVKKIREKGVMMGILAVFDEDDNIDTEKLYDVLRKAPRYDDIPFAYEVAPKEIIEHGDGKITIGIVDCGVKYGIVRELLYRGCKVIRYPPWTKPEKIVNECNGVIISNGPGNPAILTEVIKNVQALIEYEIPILGICLGHQLISLALGGRTYKLKYGHRGANKPVKDVITGRCYVTTQNHGFAVDLKSVEPFGMKLWFINIDDKTVEGLYHEKKPIITTQFHPEASPGPYDTTWIFDKFLKFIKKE